MVKREKKQASLGDSILCIGFLIFILCISLTKLGVSAHIPLALGGIFTGFVAVFKLGFIGGNFIYYKFNDASYYNFINSWYAYWNMDNIWCCS